MLSNLAARNYRYHCIIDEKKSSDNLNHLGMSHQRDDRWMDRMASAIAASNDVLVPVIVNRLSLLQN